MAIMSSWENCEAWMRVINDTILPYSRKGKKIVLTHNGLYYEDDAEAGDPVAADRRRHGPDSVCAARTSTSLTSSSLASSAYRSTGSHLSTAQCIAGWCGQGTQQLQMVHDCSLCDCVHSGC